MTVDSLDPTPTPPAEEQPKAPPTPALKLLIAINVVMFAVEVWLSGWTPSTDTLLALGANDGPSVWAGEWWRLVTSAFLHGNMLHISLNMYSLWALGAWLEMQIGSFLVVLLYLASAVVGSTASIVLGTGGLSVGASGAVFGFAGATVAVTFFGTAQQARVMRAVRGQLVWIILLNLGLGWYWNSAGGPFRIDNWAHLGGLVGGALLGASILSARRRGPWAPLTLVTSATFVLVATAMLALAVHPQAGPRQAAASARQAADRGEHVDARARVEDALREKPLDPVLVAQHHLLCVEDGDLDCAEESLRSLVGLEPLPAAGASMVDGDELVQALLVLGMESAREDRLDVAAQCFGRLSELAPDQEDHANAHAWFLLRRGHLSTEEQALALTQADRARRISARGMGGLLGPNPSITHTYAEALRQNGRVDEAVAILESFRHLSFAQRWRQGGSLFSEDVINAEIARMRAGKPPLDIPDGR